MIENTTSIDLLRHGQLATTGLFCAKPEEPLSKEGFQQLSAITKGKEWDVIISSPFLRCQSFAQQLALQNQSALYIDNAFKEMDFGSWEGLATETLWQQEADQLQQLWQSPEMFIAPRGESMQAFIKRIHQGFQYMLETHQNKSILMITHAGVIRAILVKALNISYTSTQKFTIDYASLSRLHYYQDGNYSLQFQGLGSQSI